MKGIGKALLTTLSVAMRKPVTIEYPDEKHPLPIRARSFPVLTWDFDHEEPFCTGCNICVRNCPVDCMTATMIDNPKYAEGTSNRRKIVEKFWIDYARCMRCNICVEVCPFEAIVMDNNWSGHEHAAYDRRDLHLDIDDLLQASRSGELTVPFRPQDRIDLLEAEAKGAEAPEEAFKGARPEARAAQAERIARGEGPAIQEREPEKPKVAAAAAAGAGAAAGEAEVLPESKIRAKRMRAERAAKEFEARGEPVPAEITADIEKYRNMKPGVPYSPDGAAAPAAAAGGVAGEVLTGTNPDGTMRFPPGVGTGEKGDANSPEKVRARRMRAERKFKELQEAGEAVPEDIAQTLYDLGSDLAPNGTIWAALAPAAGGGGAATAAPAAGPLTGTNSDGTMRFPPGVGTGEKGDANSPEKVRARRMRAERKAKEMTDSGEAIPNDVAQVLYETGSDLAPGGSIWEKELAGAAPPAGGGVPAPAATAGATPDGDWAPPAGVAVGAKGDANSIEKLRARRMRAERKAKEAVARGEAIPEDVLATIQELGGDLPEGAQ
ncbi:MAG: 4Fe-4S binding protein [Tepidiformaceae bacterium]